MQSLVRVNPLRLGTALHTVTRNAGTINAVNILLPGGVERESLGWSTEYLFNTVINIKCVYSCLV